MGEKASLRTTLHRHGMRVTPQRQLVLDAVRELGHATPEQVCRRVQGTAETINITTVYRALDVLEDIGLVRHTHLGHGAPTYSAEEHEHVHLVCHRCGEVDEVPSELLADLAELLDQRCGFALDAT
ncbi:Fur family transcriptional regulator, partial [Saccharopolyspora sp.]|uniref:Fur family transcriptional regulator n=1 Tax=Saccharopolyspora sp. TaxID=33915 RepID=UPI0025E083B2